jgi:peptidyl-prolyl cis-trans isomerase B (cyclophilin B)
MEQQLRQQIPDTSFAYSDSARAIYTTEGGTPNLDGMYTVFGELVEGYDVLDAIASTATARNTGQRVRSELVDRPLEPVWMIVRPLPDYTPQ